jgi:hypothetical protein
MALDGTGSWTGGGTDGVVVGTTAARAAGGESLEPPQPASANSPSTARCTP